ncbi:hypothetical protein CFO_g5542 [Ceratocystis platani]|uniref:Endonuclease/exonuclease/phosphatase domain-containing protein n=1 Tax=Ceratocystis fimbriata f. sp. platani TaxID=88771 RepID=A0A0F8AZ52_CERFI|nr:hypothetical protein CFO_g5542 [Ceratocystis platani]
MECEGAPDGASMARTAEDQVDVTMMEIIDLAMTKETGQTEAEVEGESSTEAKQPGNQEPTKGKQSGRTTERERNLSLAHNAPVALKEKTGPKSLKKVEKKVRIFVRGPVTTKEENMGTELAKIFGGTPKEFAVKKVNSGWAFYTEQGKATERNMERAKEACGAKVCEIDNKWTHARITGLSDFYVLSDKGPVPTKNEEWFTGQIARQTGGQVKAIKWQIEAEKYKDATLRVAIDLLEGKTLPSAMKFEGSNNAAQEPWIGQHKDRTKDHPEFTRHSPRVGWEDRPRSIAYVRKDIKTTETHQAHPDLCPIRIKTTQGTLQLIGAYNAPESRNCIRPGEGLQELMRSEKESTWIAIGDLNAHHRTWDANPTENEAGRTLESWMRENDLTVLNDKDEHTHSAGRVIDLVITPQTTVGKWVTCMKLIPGSTSDHEIIEVKVRTRTTRKRPEAKWRLRKMNVDTFVATCNQEADQLEKLLESNGDELDTAELLVKGLIATVERALEASTPKTPSNIVLKPWWNEGCKGQNARMRRTRTDHRNQPTDSQKRDEYAKQRKAMRQEITKAKRTLMSKIIAGLKEPKDVFRAVKWANDKVDRCIPLLQRPDKTKTTCTAESVALLLDTHTKEHTENEWFFHEPNPEANEWPPLTREEVKDSLWKPANTAPGADCITNEVWKRAWEPLGNVITKLYNLCLENGNHPSIFKEADLVAIPKPGRPRDEPRSTEEGSPSSSNYAGG